MASVPRCDGLPMPDYVRHDYSKKYPWADGTVGGYDGTTIVETLILNGNVDVDIILSFIINNFYDIYDRNMIVRKNMMTVYPFLYVSIIFNYQAKSFIAYS